MERPITNGKPAWPTLAGRLNQPPATRAEAVRQLQTMIPITPLAQRVLKSSNGGSSGGPKKTGKGQ
ncbi:MAG TPA: hypothetical protein VK742_17895 [Candidatus Sulfotelmatobacter sp.]|jgi:hypothetical protein|nr:hypothetical protein [Candidatus Sulfotelmatobacter sp.]